MEPTNNSYQPGTDLPRPNDQAGSDSVPQNTPVNPVQPNDTSTPVPPALPVDDTVSTPSSKAPPTPDIELDPVQAADITPPAAEDTDLIEQEWVDKAKAIVNNTSHDPHTMNKEINKFKADYIKKRYNKEIKVITD